MLIVAGHLAGLPAEFLRGENINLISPNLIWVEAMHALVGGFSYPHYEFLSWANEQISLDDTRVNMQVALDNFEGDKNEYRFLIISNGSENLLGCISLFIRNSRIPYYEIGYWLATEVMGKGYATEACLLVRDIADKFLQAKRIEIRTARRNVRSIQVALRCGFECEAVLANERIDQTNRLDDTCIYLYTKVDPV